MININEGDIVTIFWGDGTQQTDCIVVHAAGNTGELWYFTSPVSGEIAVNPCASNFDYMEKQKDVLI